LTDRLDGIILLAPHEPSVQRVRRGVDEGEREWYVVWLPRERKRAGRGGGKVWIEGLTIRAKWGRLPELRAGQGEGKLKKKWIGGG